MSAVQRLLKTLREKKKLLVTSNFSFSHSVYYSFGELSSIFIGVGIGGKSGIENWAVK